MHSNTLPKPRIIVFGLAFGYPFGGFTFQFLHFLIGLRRLGYDVYYVEDSGRFVYDPTILDQTPDASRNVNVIAPIMEAHGFAGRWAYRGAYEGGKCYGMTSEQIDELYGTADACLNVTGAQELREEHLRIPRRIYVETDPVVSQIEIEAGNAQTIAQLDAHHVHFTYGENLGNPDCLLPAIRYKWMPTRQPVLLDFWENDFDVTGRPYTTITTWRNYGRDIEYKGVTYYWSKHHEFLKILDMPLRLAGKAKFELATGLEAPRELLEANGWLLQDGPGLSCDFEGYRQYIQKSRAQFTVAKDQNIRLRSGWFSDRDVCYLAAGRPVITQETGFSNILPTGKALFGFLTLADIERAVDTIERDYAAASREATAIAHECFAAEKVLASLMSRAGLGI